MNRANRPRTTTQPSTVRRTPLAGILPVSWAQARFRRFWLRQRFTGVPSPKIRSIALRRTFETMITNSHCRFGSKALDQIVQQRRRHNGVLLGPFANAEAALATLDSARAH